MSPRALWTGSLCLAALAGPVLAPGALAGEPEMRGTPSELRQYLKPPSRQVVLQGHAKQTVQSDVGHADVIVRTSAKDLAAALRANAARREAFAAALAQRGIDAREIRAQKFSTSPQFGWFGKAPSAYEVTNRLTVTITDDRQLQAVAEAAAQSPETSFDGARFEVAKEAELSETVRHQAFDDAMARRRFFEERLGATLRPVGFRYLDGSASETGVLEEIIVTGTRKNAIRMDAPVAQDSVPTFDERVFEAYVDVTFEVEPAQPR
ncbi:MAG: hypothetical protein RL684_3008 [Pseudomonadota bacterium]|jgi:uncharacterized protein YggE